LHGGIQLLDDLDQFGRRFVEVGNQPFQVLRRTIGHIELQSLDLRDKLRIVHRIGEGLCASHRRVPCAEALKRALGDRVTIVVSRDCSHAAVVEQPDAISDALTDCAKTLWPKN
jgi:hypothetical protein